MTIEQAKKELERPLVFGDSLQIKAIEVLENAISDEKVEMVREQLHEIGCEGWQTNADIRQLMAEIASIMQESD